MRKTTTSLQLFREHIKRREEDSKLDVSGVISRECYLQWIDTKLAQETDNEAKKYHRTLTNHVSGVDGRSPFDPEEEAAILVLFRQKQPWPCFPAHLAAMGRRYRTKGFHEKQREKKAAAQAAPSPSPPHATTSTSSPPASTTTSASPPSPPDASSSLSLSSTPSPSSSAAVMAATASAASSLLDHNCSNVDEMCNALSAADAQYIKNLRDQVVANYVTPQYSPEAWRSINEAFRFMVLAKATSSVQRSLSPADATAARDLCDKFSIDDATVSMVFDMTAKSYLDRALFQNECSLRWFDPLVGENNASITEPSELYRVVVAVGAAFHQLGRPFWVYGQLTKCRQQQTALFDMCYYADPSSLFLVVFGRPCSSSDTSTSPAQSTFVL